MYGLVNKDKKKREKTTKSNVVGILNLPFEKFLSILFLGNKKKMLSQEVYVHNANKKRIKLR